MDTADASAPESAHAVPLLLDRYRPMARIGRGGMAFVFRGRDEYLGRDVAIKVFSGGNEEHTEMYRAELRMLAALNHHGVVSIIDAGVDTSAPEDPRPFLVMQLVRGTTVRDRVAERPISVREIGEIGYEVAEALEYVHAQHVIHRDITPSNIMIVNYGTQHARERAMLTDFGIAVEAADAGFQSETITGTAPYLSPEQVRNQPLTTASDIYSLGLVLLECFTRERAFPGAHIPSAMARLTEEPDMPPELVPEPWRSLLQRMTAAEPEHRPTAAELSSEIRLALRDIRPRQHSRGMPWRRRRGAADTSQR
ncbi:serine/threonine-protein kinase [Agromyces salentinus]|uniref:non-specific serine/threonine protein kinase n=1 Tax=Agromyces salentinus TaxID=269421 RepID=A0ABN2MRW8_9MICO|nr:serine/threonine-protein kinase [Agromyces salentinus]